MGLKSKLNFYTNRNEQHLQEMRNIIKMMYNTRFTIYSGFTAPSALQSINGNVTY